MTKTRYAADDAAAIKARMEEIQQERMQAIMGKPIEEAKAVEQYLAGAITVDADSVFAWNFNPSDDLPTA